MSEVKKSSPKVAKSQKKVNKPTQFVSKSKVKVKKVPRVISKSKRIIKVDLSRGRPTKYDPKFASMMIKFFSGPKFERFIKSEKQTTKSNGTTEKWVEYGYRCRDLPTLNKFARKIGVNGDTIVEWAEAKYPLTFEVKALAGKLKYPEFSAAYNTVKELQKEFLSDNALKGFSPPASFIFVAKNITNWKDKQEVDNKHSGELVVRRASYKDLGNGTVS